MTVSLLDLPASLLIDSVFSHLSAHDLTQLALVSRHARALVENDLVWARRLATDFHFPLRSSARPLASSSADSSQSWWKTIYARLSNPHAFVWGQATFERLGLDFNSFPQPIFDLARSFGGVPFPVPLPAISPPHRIGALIRQSNLKIGPPVSLHAGGWSFHALTSSGHVIIWGVLNGEVYVGSRSHFVAGRHHTTASHYEQPETDLAEQERMLHRWTHPGASVPEPTILPIPPSLRITQLDTGRKHAVALAKVRDLREGDVQSAQALGSFTASAAAKHQQVDLNHAVLLEWHTWGEILRVDLNALFKEHLPSSEAASDTTQTRTEIVQVEAGWEYSAVLSHRHETQNGRQRTLSEVHFWLTGWSQSARRRAPMSQRQGRRLGGDEGQDSRQDACKTLATISPIAVQLPPLPPPPTGLLSSIEREREHLQSRHGDEDNSGFGTGSSSLDRYYAAARRAGPSAAARIAERTEKQEQLIIQIAAGSSFLLALTDKGLVYRMDILRGRRLDMDLEQIAEMFRTGGSAGNDAPQEGEIEMDEDERRTNAEAYAYRQAMYAAWRRGDDPSEGWELLEPFCVPRQIARCGAFAKSSPEHDHSGSAEDEEGTEGRGHGAQLTGYVDASIRITHISAHFRDFAAFSVSSTSRLGQTDTVPVTSSSSETGIAAKSIVLLGNEESTLYPDGIQRRHPRRRADGAEPAEVEEPLLYEPEIIPELQSRSIIKVVHGDYHAGALDASGQVVSWGSWSNGALGIYDALGNLRPTRASQADQFRQALAHRMPWTSSFLSPQREQEQLPGQVEDERNDLSSEARMRRRTVRKDVRTGEKHRPTRVTFDDYREEEARPKFVFDLAMSGWQSGALAVDYDGEVNLARTEASSLAARDATSQRQNMKSETRSTPASSATPIVRMQAHRPALSLDANPAFEPTFEFEDTTTSSPEWRTRAAFVQSPTSMSNSIFPALFGGGLMGPQQRGPPTRIIAHGRVSDTDLSDAASAERSGSRTTTTATREADELEAAGRRTFYLSVGGVALSIFGLFGGWEHLILSDADDDDDPAFMRWPFNLAYFLPLLVPLTLYIVIARWTGEKLFRHS